MEEGKDTVKDKRYLVFEYETCYPGGGMNDLTASYDTINEAMQHLQSSNSTYIDIYDRVEGVMVMEEYRPKS